MRRAFLSLCILVLLAAPASAGGPEIPQTPAGKVFAAWLTALNSGDPARYRAFDAAYPRKDAPPM
ncbi:MAG TPA: hypothetical protein VIJ61_13290, partial [Thermoanaerobaculia bacterium]